MATQSTALVILGMHRSGTSSLAGVVSRLGCALGEDLLEANEWNPLGYGEHREIVERHDALLRSAGLSWLSARAPDLGAASIRAAGPELSALLARDFAAEPLFALKDPRMCRLLPLWRDVFATAEVDARYALVLRHPLEIAASLERRDGFPLSHSLLLWASHLIAAERNTRDGRRAFVDYAALMRDWRGVAKRLGEDLGIVWPRPPDSAAAEIDAYLRADLRHHSSPSWPPGDAQRFPWAVALHEALANLAEDDHTEARARLDDVAASFDAAAALYAPELAAADDELAAARAETREAERACAKAERKLSQLADGPTLWLRTYLRRRLGRGEP